MRSFLVAVVLLSFGPTVARADDGIPIETLQKIKDATVYVKVEGKGVAGSASGFLIKVDGTTALIVTNHHVIEPEVLEITSSGRFGGPMRRGPFGPPFPGMAPRITVRACKDAKATVVLYSGTPRELSVPAEVAAADADLDLAILKISNVKKLPSPIEFDRDLKLIETMPVYIFGFPFGKTLATGQGSPAITIGKGSVSSLRLGDDGELARVQIDGSMNPGNSGGPVVDSHGTLVGISVATISNSSGIGLAIPGRQLPMMFEGRIGKPHLFASRSEAGLLVINVEVPLIDPLRKIKTVTLDYLAANQVEETPEAGARLSKVHGCRKVSLQVEGLLASGKFSPRKGVTEVRLICQAVGKTVEHKESLTKIGTDTLRLSDVRATATATSKPGAKPGAMPAAPAPSRDESTGAATKIAGGGGRQFTDEAPEGGMLIGFEVGLGKWGNNDVVHAIRPIFRGADGKEVFGKQHGTGDGRTIVVKARRGFAVGAINAKSMALLDGFSVTFMKVIGKDKLDPKKTYQSEWVGGQGGRETILGGDGTLTIGVVGHENTNLCTGIGLLRKR